MPQPEGYRKALRLFKHANKFNIPIVTIIDTPGAYPGLKAEETGQGEAIARNLLEMAKAKEQADKRLLFLEIVVGMICVAVMLALAMVASFVQMEEWLRIVLILIGLAPLLIATPFMLKIEQTAGYYECAECGHRYIPSYKSVFMAPHMGRTRRMKCPKCHQRSWQKKVLSKE